MKRSGHSDVAKTGDKLSLRCFYP